VTLGGKLTDGRDTIEGTDDTVNLRDHGVELFEGGTLTVIPWHRSGRSSERPPSPGSNRHSPRQCWAALRERRG
jgi:hypothetical protein